MWSMMADALFALLAFLIVYHHLLYPLLLKNSVAASAHLHLIFRNANIANKPEIAIYRISP